MDRRRTLTTAVLGASLAVGLMLLFIGEAVFAKFAAAPALILLGWAAIGHFITLDDDMPGEWSNPAGSKKVWYGSLAELFVKAAAFVAVVLLIYV